MGARTRRSSSIVLAALTLVFGLCLAVAPASAGDRLAANSPAMTALVPAAVAHAVRSGVDTAAQARPGWQRHTGGWSPVAAAVLLTTLLGGLPRRWRPTRRGPAAGPAADGRFASAPRAPPAGLR